MERRRADGRSCPDGAVSDPAGETAAGLTARELEILRLVAEGWSDRRIAAALAIRQRTVEWHVANILRKLGVASRTAAAAFAIRHGLA